MKTGFNLACALATLAVMAAPAIAQLPQVNQPTATVLAQGMDPGATGDATADAFNDIQVTLPGTLVLTHQSTNANVPLILTASLVDPTTGATTVLSPLPWGDFYDLGTAIGSNVPDNVQVIGDGNNVNAIVGPFFGTDGGNPTLGLGPQFVWAVGVSENLNNSHVAFQSVFNDPTNGPFFLRNAAASSCNFINGQELVLLLGDDGALTVPFLPGSSFHFHGVGYTEVSVAANGLVTFGNLPTAAGFTVDTVAWANAEPSIAGHFADWSPQVGSATDGVFYEEIGKQLRVAWGDPATNSIGGVVHFLDNDMNMFDINLELDCTADPTNPNAGQFSICHIMTDATADLAQRGRGVMGQTAGSVSTPASLADTGFTSTSVGGPNDAQIEEHHPGRVPSATAVGRDGLGTIGEYNNIVNWDGNGVDFAPNGGDPTGALGYTATKKAQLPCDLTGVLGGTNLIDSSTAGTPITLAGRFDMVDSLSKVTFDPAGLAIPLAIIGVVTDSPADHDSTSVNGLAPFPKPAAPSAIRDGEGLVVDSSGLVGVPKGVYDIEIDCDCDGTADASATVGIDTQVFSLPDDGDVLVDLTGTVEWYGTIYTQLRVGSNGFVNFGGPVGVAPSFTITQADFAAGFQAPGSVAGGAAANPGMAILWNDMNLTQQNGGAYCCGNGTYSVCEDTTANTVTVTMDDLDNWDTGNPCGTVSVTFGTFGPNTAELDISGFIADAATTQMMLIGVTDGDDSASTGADTPVDLSAGHVTLAGNEPETLSEMFPANADPDFAAPAPQAGMLSFIGTTTGSWTVF